MTSQENLDIRLRFHCLEWAKNSPYQHSIKEMIDLAHHLYEFVIGIDKYIEEINRIKTGPWDND